MEFINFIIDRVEETYIFNLIETAYPSRYLHYKNKISNSFIQHFLNEVNNINDYILSFGNQIQDITYLNAMEKLKKISEVFFNQFIPDEIKEKMIMSNEGYLFLHIDSSLASIPWELLFDGKEFLGDKFRIGRSVNSHWSKTEILQKTKLKILILANPTKDLPEAEEEGNSLADMLTSEISSDLFEIQLYVGERINKLKFLSEMHNYDIIHYAGHIVYNEEYPEGGILLSQKEILSSNEIKKIKNAPSLIFLNACKSAIIESNTGIANAFLAAKAGCYIGTNWNIPDSKKTIEFALNFYRFLFDEKTIGDSFFEARKIVKENKDIYDFVWASYVLHGNPIIKIFRYPQRRSYEAFRSDWNLRKVFNEFPTFIAVPYFHYTKNNQSIHLLITTYVRFIFIIAILIIEYYKNLGLELESFYDKIEQKEILDYINDDKDHEAKNFDLLSYLNIAYLCARKINLIKIESSFTPLIKNFLLHREDLEKILILLNDYKSKLLNYDEEKEAFLVSFQYLLENLFIDFSFVSKIEIFYNNGTENPSILFKGQIEKYQYILPTFSEDFKLKEFVKICTGKVCTIQDSVYLCLSKYLEYDPISRNFKFYVNESLS